MKTLFGFPVVNAPVDDDATVILDLGAFFKSIPLLLARQTDGSLIVHAKNAEGQQDELFGNTVTSVLTDEIAKPESST